MSASDSPTPTSPTARTVACPTCGGASLFAPSNTYRPFCSERCKNVDLGAWATEGYRVPAAPPPEGDEDELGPDAILLNARPPLH